MKNLDSMETWYITGSQHLYGEAVLKKVAANARQIVRALNDSKRLPLKVVFKPVLTTPDDIRRLCLEANHAPKCAGLILWMHTFSPSKMWSISASRTGCTSVRSGSGKRLRWTLAGAPGDTAQTRFWYT